MLKRVDPHRYPPSAYDDEWCLKPPPLLWIALLYLSRGLVVPPLMGMGHYSGVNPDALGMLRDFWQPLCLIPAVIALPVLITAFRRVPRASDAMRWIWRQGRPIVVLAALADITVSLAPTLQRGEFDDASLVPGFCAAFDLYFIAYLLLAARVRDTFCDFPERTAPSEAARPGG